MRCLTRPSAKQPKPKTTVTANTTKTPLTLKSEIVLISHDGGWDDEPSTPSQSVYTLEELIETYKDDLDLSTEYVERVMAGAGTEQDLNWFLWDCLRDSEILDSGHGWTNIIRKEEFDEQRKEAEYARAERAVQGFCARKGIAPNTIQFVLALEAEQDSLNYRREVEFGYERRAERWMDSRFSGQSEDGFWSDESFLNNGFSREQDNIDLVLSWLHRNCPLLMAKVEEYKLANPQSEEDDQ
jgi:hypothetical protein